jgi:hypothetical protein
MKILVLEDEQRNAMRLIRLLNGMQRSQSKVHWQA